MKVADKRAVHTLFVPAKFCLVSTRAFRHVTSALGEKKCIFLTALDDGGSAWHQV